MNHIAVGYAKRAVMACLAVGATALSAPAAASAARGIRMKTGVWDEDERRLQARAREPPSLHDDDQGRSSDQRHGDDADHPRTLLVASGRGRLSSGKATLTMRVLHRMTPGSYTVSMVVTIGATMVVRIR
jgi:hypothetical protein